MTLRIRFHRLGVPSVFRLPLRIKNPAVASSQDDGAGGDGPDGSHLSGLSDLPGTAASTDLTRLSTPAELAEEADCFLRDCYSELDRRDELDRRRRIVSASIALTGTYEHTYEELEYGARVAWRNSSRCIGRLYWQSLKLRDRRHVTTPVKIAAVCT
jgi:hypothetical protein